MKKKAAVLLLVFLIGCPTVMFGQVMSGTVGLLGFGPGWYAGATRVIQATVTRAGVSEVANVALTAAMRGGIASAVIMGMVLAEPAFNSGVDAIRTYMGTIGYLSSGSGLQKPGGVATWVANPGTNAQTLTTNVLAHFSGGGFQASIEGNAADALAWATAVMHSASCGANGYISAQGGNCGSYCTSGTATFVTTEASCPNHTTGFPIYSEGLYPANTTTYNQGTEGSTPPPVPASLADLNSQVTTDLTAGNAGAKAAADEAEDVMSKGLQGILNPAATPRVTDTTAAAPTTGAVVGQAIPATGTGATTPAAGTDAATPQQLPYTDPAYAGQVTTVPWSSANSFADRWNTFQSSIQTSGLFGLWGSSFGSVPSGGSSSYTFNAGVFGNHTYDFSSWGSTVFGLLSGIIQISCGFVAVKIATLGHA